MHVYFTCLGLVVCFLAVLCVLEVCIFYLSFEGFLLVQSLQIPRSVVGVCVCPVMGGHPVQGVPHISDIPWFPLTLCRSVG